MKKQGFLLFLFLILGAATAQADAKHFTYSYEADGILPKGKWETEQWITLGSGKHSGNFVELDFRNEIEHGFTSKLTGSVYLNYSVIHSKGVDALPDEDKADFRGISTEWKYMVVSPDAHPIGVLLYIEPAYKGHKQFEMEEKLVLQHNFGPNWILAFNTTLEHEWDFKPSPTEKELELSFTAGLSRRIANHWWFGIEAKCDSAFPDYKRREFTVLSAGPVVQFEYKKFWATLTALPQLGGTHGREFDDHYAVETRFIAGFMF
jgi:hypothetical protein